MLVVQHVIELDEVIVPEAERGFVARQAHFVRETHDDLLAVYGRDGADTDIVFLMVDDNGRAAVLRAALLGNIHAGDDLHTGDDAGVDGIIVAHGLDEVAVDAEPHADAALDRFEMNIGGSLPDGLLDDGADHDDDRRIVLGNRGGADGVLLGIGPVALAL